MIGLRVQGHSNQWYSKRCGRRHRNACGSISRVTTRKYVHTLRGVYELKYFFNSSISTAGGDAIASEAVKDEIKKLVAAENPKSPMSDKAIADALAESGTMIARVQSLNIEKCSILPPARDARSFKFFTILNKKTYEPARLLAMF